MPQSSRLPLERAKPLFGAVVSVRVDGCDHGRAMRASERAFGAMASVHRLMSFHDPSSELSRLNREARDRPVRISRKLAAVLTESLAVARASEGVFDPTVAALAVRAGALPRPPGAGEPDPAADWRDVELDADRCTVRFRRGLWLDLGGVAKGYAVDLACEVLRRSGVAQACVNAGGDLRVFGRRPETVTLDTGAPRMAGGRAVSLADRSLASSGRVRGRARAGAMAVHFDGDRRRRVPPRFAAVIAERCVHADALTKVVLARGLGSARVLAVFGAAAAICSDTLRWTTSGTIR